MTIASTAQRRRAPDASMELLNSIQRETIDPEYAQHAADGEQGRGPAPWLVLVVGLLAGLMFTTSGLRGGVRTEPVVAERADLIVQIEAAQERNEELQARSEALTVEIQELDEQLSGGVRPDPGDEVWAGTIAVTGSGIALTINDNPRDANGIIVDQDLRQVVNGLWLAGAEAVAINGYRLSARTAIRQAGSATTVDYRSMTTPYRIEAIGDPQELVRRFNTNPGGSWLTYIRGNYGVTSTIETRSELALGPDSGLGVEQARVP